MTRKELDTTREYRNRKEYKDYGIAGDSLKEEVPKFNKRNGDIVIEGQNNAWIVLGRDRPLGKPSGYGGMSPPLGSKAGAIDLVVGRMGNEPSSEMTVENNFFTDSARIYISQKTDIDKNFGIRSGTDVLERSGVGIKADAVRIIGRQGIKLVSGVINGETNSLGQNILKTEGIDLIAGSLETNSLAGEEAVYGPLSLQPLVKGNNLLKSLNELADQVENLSGLLSTFLASQMLFNSVASVHYHYSPFYGIPSTPSDILAQQGIKTNMQLLKDCVLKLSDFKLNIMSFRTNYLTPQQKYYICSNFNRTN